MHLLTRRAAESACRHTLQKGVAAFCTPHYTRGYQYPEIARTLWAGAPTAGTHLEHISQPLRAVARSQGTRFGHSRAADSRTASEERMKCPGHSVPHAVCDRPDENQTSCHPWRARQEAAVGRTQRRTSVRLRSGHQRHCSTACRRPGSKMSMCLSWWAKPSISAQPLSPLSHTRLVRGTRLAGFTLLTRTPASGSGG